MSKTLLTGAADELEAGPVEESNATADADSTENTETTRDEVSGQATSVRLKVRSADTGRNGFRPGRAESEPKQSTLAAIRKARILSQATLAEIMEMDEDEVSELERRSDMLLSTFRRFVEATGGDLHLVARYGGSEVEVTFGEAVSDSSAR